jgi:hypothetical protein
MRVSERNETCFNCRTEAVSHLQNAKTQKCKKGAKSIFPIDKENAYILQRKIEEGKSVHRGFALWVCSKPLISGLITYF